MNNNNNKCPNKGSYNEDFQSIQNFYQSHDTFYMKNRCNSNNNNSYNCYFYGINNFPQKNNYNDYKNNNDNKWSKKTSYSEEFLSNKNFCHSHDSFCMKKRFNSINSISYNCNFCCIIHFSDKNNNNDYMYNSNINGLIKPDIITIFLVMRIFIITTIIFA